jgi:ATP-dependent Clp protease ATP-binding subunit ClpC
VNRIAQTEINSHILPELIESKVIGQKEAVLKLRDRFREIVRD